MDTRHPTSGESGWPEPGGFDDEDRGPPLRNGFIIGFLSGALIFNPAIVLIVLVLAGVL